MLKALYTAATGMKVQQKNVDVIANNLANVNTTGFKKSQANFEDLIYVTEKRPGFGQSGKVGSSSGVQIGSGARLVSVAKIFTQGVLQTTGRDMDVAVMGDGFFEVELPDGSMAYTRDGNFHQDSQNLVTGDGYKLTSTVSFGGGPYEKITIAADGEVFGFKDNENESMGNIKLATFLNPAGLESVGNNLYRPTVSSGDAEQGKTPGEDGVGALQAGFLEKSNVDVVNELVSLIIAQRAYEVNSKAIKTGDDMLTLANNLTT
jgi:flagellar basal-body rod protein FlgG